MKEKNNFIAKVMFSLEYTKRKHRGFSQVAVLTKKKFNFM